MGQSIEGVFRVAYIQNEILQEDKFPIEIKCMTNDICKDINFYALFSGSLRRD